MAVSVNSTAALEIGRPVALFPTNVPITTITDDRNSYVPSADGQRFLVNELVDSGNSQPWNVILNWNSPPR
jgi:hypothetical protein